MTFTGCENISFWLSLNHCVTNLKAYFNGLLWLSFPVIALEKLRTKGKALNIMKRLITYRAYFFRRVLNVCLQKHFQDEFS